MFEHEMEESKKVSFTENVACQYLYLVKEENIVENLRRSRLKRMRVLMVHEGQFLNLPGEC